MTAAALPAPFDPRRIFTWRRLRFALGAAVPFGLMMGAASPTPMLEWLARTMVVALFALAAFGLLEQAPDSFAPRIARWVQQLLAVVVAVPIGAYAAYWLTTGDAQFWHLRPRAVGWFELSFTGVLFAPWFALAAMLRQREAFARHQALAFQLERSELERQALDGRLRLLQAQVQPHFLFNTLANVRALVRTGSPRAPEVLDSLIAYLRASVPHLDAPTTTIAQETTLVRAYLELMHMRMPDRLQYALHVADDTLALACPPMTLLTLVENAVRHGIDPSEEGGRIEVGVSRHADRCVARVVDTGVGLTQASDGLGTGLANLRERLALAFGGDVRVSLVGVMPHGVSAEIEFPAKEGTT